MPSRKSAAHVAHEDEIIALSRRDPALEPQQRLLGRAQGQGRMRATLHASASERAASAAASGRISPTRPQARASSAPTRRAVKKHVPDPRRADEPGEPRRVGDRKAIAERARDWKAEAQICCGEAQIARRRERRAAASAGAGYRGDRRNGAALECTDHAVEPRLVGERVLRRREGAELRDVGARREGLAARAGDDEGAQRPIASERSDKFFELIIHREGQRVARRGSVEGNRADPVLCGVEDVLHHQFLPVHNLRARKSWYRQSFRALAILPLKRGVRRSCRPSNVGLAAALPRIMGLIPSTFMSGGKSVSPASSAG